MLSSINNIIHQQQQHHHHQQNHKQQDKTTRINPQNLPLIQSCNDYFTAEYEINDLRLPIRNILTKGQTQDEIAHYSGASVTTRGRYISFQDKNRNLNQQFKPLYLFIRGSTQQAVSLAIDKICDIITPQDSQMATTPNTKFNMRQPPPPMAPSQHLSNNQQQTFAEKLTIGLDHAPSAFNLREQVIGAGGANLNYIRNETGAIATLRGRGSMFIDPVLGTESPEPLHLYIEHPRFEGLQAAKQLAKNLIETLQQEVIHFQQLSNQNAQNAAFSTATATANNAANTQGVTIQQAQQTVPQINVPPPSLIATVPPPIIQQNAIDPQTNQQTIVQQNFIQQNPPPTLTGTAHTVQSQPQTIIHQQIIPQSVPIQLQQGNMVIQQPVQQPPTITNVSIPPPSIQIPIKTGQIVQFQQPPPPHGTHLTQPPPNVQLQQSQQATTTQIVLNHPQNYQYQYIQQPMQTTAEAQLQPNQVTIQHIYQPQQQIQGIVQQTAQPQGQTFEQFHHIRPQQFQTAPPQQYITVQGNTAYMVPPPTIIQQQTPQPATQQTVQAIGPSNPNIIFQPPPQLQQVQMQTISVQNLPQQLPLQHDQTNQVNGTDETRSSPNLKEDSKSDNGDNSDQKDSELKLENDSHSAEGNIESSSANQSSSVVTSSSSTAITMTVPPPTFQNITIRPPPSHPHAQQQIATAITQVPPPMMAVPPPVQQIVGNALITTHPQATQHTGQIYNQVHVPVSIQQIQQTGQQFHVSTATGQHILVNATPQWSNQQAGAQLAQSQQLQQIQPNGTIQNVQITHQIAPEFRTIPPPGTQTATTQQVMTINPHVQVHLSGQQPTQQFNFVQTPNITHQQQYQTFMTPIQQQPSFSDQVNRIGQKRKYDDDDSGGPPSHQPRVGMGGGTSTATGNGSNNSNGQDESNNGSQKLQNHDGQQQQTSQHMQQQLPLQATSTQQQQQQHQQQSSQLYQRDMNDGFNNNGDGSSTGNSRLSFDGQIGNMNNGPFPSRFGPRFHHGYGGGGGHQGYISGRPPNHGGQGDGNNFPMHRLNFGPPPPPYRNGDNMQNMGGYGLPPHPRFRAQQW